MKEVIFYRFKKGFSAYLWLTFDIVVIACLLIGLWNCPQCLKWWQYPLFLVLFGAHLGLWFYKYMCDNVMAVITDESIKIDHTNPIKWDDIAYAEEKIVDCCSSEKKIISLVPHDGINYKYNWLQKHNAGFTAFSIPLYGIISPQDEEKICKIIDKKLGLNKKTTAKNKAVATSKKPATPKAKKTASKKK